MVWDTGHGFARGAHRSSFVRDLGSSATTHDAQYHKLLARCATLGAWQDAIRVYEAMTARNMECDAYTFSNIIMACKNATPCQAAKAIAVFDEMERVRRTNLRTKADVA